MKNNDLISESELTTYFSFPDKENVLIDFSYEDRGANLHMPQTSKLNIEKIKSFKTGILYEIKIQNADNFLNLKDELTNYSNRISLGILFVNKTNIYKIEISRNEAENISNEKDIKEKGYIISNNVSMGDAIDKSIKGREWHTYIEVDNDKCRWGGYEQKQNDEPGFYETFVWQKHKGLVFYQCGVKAKSRFIEIDVK